MLRDPRFQVLSIHLGLWTKTLKTKIYLIELKENLQPPLSGRKYNLLIALEPEDSLLLSLRCRPPLLAHQPIPGWLNADLNFNEVVHCEVVHDTALQT